MEFRLLGPLEVRDDGRAIDLGAAKLRALLAILALNANQVVSKDMLIESLWGERAPETAPKALQVYVSQLRKVLGRDRIATRTPGYELRVHPGELDIDRFEHLMSNGQHGEALQLWRGSPLADFAYEPFAQAEIARLEEIGLACLEQRIDVDLAAGDHAALVGELEGLVHEHPLRERLRAQLMLALYRSGRQADALHAYQSGRTLLDEELGLEPGAELKALQRLILAQDTALDLPAGQTQPGTQHEPVPKPPESTTVRPREGRKTVTVLSCDIAASGDGELDPESLRRVTERGFEELLPVLEAYGATVERSLGGAVSAIFGIPVVHEDDALRAARAAVEMRERIAALDGERGESGGAGLELRVGIGTGAVFVGAGGDHSFPTGQPVQSAIRLQQSARPGELLVDERTHRLVRDAVDSETAGEHARLLGVRAVVSLTTSRFDSPMVGREREQRRLHGALDQALADRSCQLFTILGAPGVGKSRLVREFVEAVSGDALVARGRCLPYGEGITYWPVREAVWDVAELDDKASAEENLTTLAELLDDSDEAEVVAERVGRVLGLSDRPSGVEETFGAVRTFVELLARSKPLVVVFDDIHWGEATFLDLVDHVVDWMSDAPALLLCVARPELLEVRPGWGGGKPNATSVRLEPLSEAESEALLDNLAGDDLEDPARRRIIESAGGNPLFVEEMLALLLEDGRGADFEVPATIQALLAARLDRLPDDERTTLEAASVEGKVFHEASVAELTDADPGKVRDTLLALARRDLVLHDKPVFSGESAYHFRHLLIRDAAYESISKERRAGLHERHAAWLDARALELDEIVGYHYEQAFKCRVELGPVDEHARALGRHSAERLGSAGRRAFTRSDAPAGANLISRAVAMLSPDDPLRVELVPNVRVVQALTDLGWADRVLTEAVEAAATSGDRRLAAHALVQRGFLRLFTDVDVTPGELLDVSERAITVFDDLGDELGLARGWRLAAQAHYLDRQPASCAAASEHALRHARRTEDRFEVREIVEWLTIAHLLGSTAAADAAARCESLLDEVADRLELHPNIHATLGALAAMQGRFDEAQRSMERSKRTEEEFLEWNWIVPLWLGFAYLWQDDLESAEAELRPAYESLKTIGETTHFSSFAHYLSVVAYAQERYDEAKMLTRECEDACSANDVHSHILWRSIRAKCLAREQRAEEAEHLAREAVALAQTGDFLLAHADAVSDLGEVLELVGAPEKSVPILETAIALYEQKGDVVDVARTRARLERLTGGV